jgi:hypothetical protein
MNVRALNAHLATLSYRAQVRYLKRLVRQQRRERRRVRRRERWQAGCPAVRNVVNRARGLVSRLRISIGEAITNALALIGRVLLACLAYITGAPALLLINLKSLINMNTTTNEVPTTVSAVQPVETIHAYTRAIAALQTCLLDSDGVAQAIAGIRAHSPAEAETIVRLMRENDDAWIVPHGGGAVTVQRR